MTNSTQSSPKGLYGWLGQQLAPVIITTILATIISTQVQGVRITNLETQVAEGRGDLKQISESVNKMAVSFAELSQVVKDEIVHARNQR